MTRAGETTSHASPLSPAHRFNVSLAHVRASSLAAALPPRSRKGVGSLSIFPYHGATATYSRALERAAELTPLATVPLPTKVRPSTRPRPLRRFSLSRSRLSCLFLAPPPTFSRAARCRSVPVHAPAALRLASEFQRGATLIPSPPPTPIRSTDLYLARFPRRFHHHTLPGRNFYVQRGLRGNAPSHHLPIYPIFPVQEEGRLPPPVKLRGRALI